MQRLLVTWAIVSTILVALVTVQAVAGKYGDDYSTAVNWVMGLIIPQLSILTTAAFGEPSTRWKNARANLFRFRSAWWGSVVIAGVALATVFVEPLADITPYELFDRTGIFLSLLQGMVLAAIAAVVFEGR